MLSCLLPVFRAGPAAAAGTAGGERILVDAVAATVNGEAITQSDVERRFLEWEAIFTRDEIVRRLARERAILQNARRAGVKVSDAEVKEAMRLRLLRVGGEPEYRAMLEQRGITRSEDEEDVRKLLLARAYVDQCLGLAESKGNLHPSLARLMRLRRSEEFDYYALNRDRFQFEGALEVALVRVPRNARLESGSAREVVERIRGEAISLAMDRESPCLLVAAAAVAPDLAGILSGPPDLPSGLPEEVDAFVAAAPVGVVSPVFETEEEFLVVSKIRYEPARTREFPEVQPYIRQVLLASKRRIAETALSYELLREAVLWPEELFVAGGNDAGGDRGPDADQTLDLDPDEPAPNAGAQAGGASDVATPVTSPDRSSPPTRDTSPAQGRK